jgi:hypothetical protein
VPYSDEFRERTPNDALLTQLAAIVPKGGKAGLVIEPPEHSTKTKRPPPVNPYRHDLPKATSSQDAWHYFLLMACCLLFADVFCRRVHINFAWVPPLAVRTRDWVLRRTPKPAAPEFMQRLRSRKQEVSGQLDQLHAAARFEPTSQTPLSPDVLKDAATPTAPADRSAPSLADQPKAEGESYTERLLKAKKKVWQDREKK